MQVSVHGSTHREIGVSNQDACRELISEDRTKKVRIVCDGCTNIDPENPKTFLETHSEVGASLFCSLYLTLPDPFDEEKFPENAEMIMEKMLALVGFSKDMPLDSKEYDYIMHNYYFTILATFETQESFVTYCFGDGVIFVVNHLDVVTYIERKRGNNPPYLINNFLLPDDAVGSKEEFRKFVFSKKDVKNVGIASDGLIPVIKKEPAGEELANYEKAKFDRIFEGKNSIFCGDPSNELRNIIFEKSNCFYDDTTVVW